MAVGDKQDIYKRLIQDLPGWFGSGPDANGENSNHPNLDQLLEIFITTYYFHYNQQYLYAALQQRIQTATDVNLDIISQDYMGPYLPRFPKENDDTFRKRILANIVKEKATRYGMFNALLILTGFPPIIYEGWNANDVMVLGDGSANPLTSNPIHTGGLSYIDNMGVQHTYGNEVLGNMSAGIGFPYQFSIVVFLHANQGLGQFPGLNNAGTISPNTYFGLGYNWYLGNQSMVTQIITENIIRQTIELTKPLGTHLSNLLIIFINS